MSTVPHTTGAPVDEHTRRHIRGRRDLSVSVSRDSEIRLNECIIVRAGAGSGKTSVLIERMIALVRSGVRLENIVAITFTKKASGELQERFFGQLLETGIRIRGLIGDGEGADVDAWKKEASCVAQAVRSAENVFIGTIHAFCTLLLRQRAMDLGIPPEFEQIDEQEEEKLRRTFWNRHLNEASRNESADLELLQSADISFDALFDMFGKLALNTYVRFDLSGCARPDPEKVFKQFNVYLDALAHKKPASDNPDGFLDFLERAIGLRSAAGRRRDDAFFQVLLMRMALEAIDSTQKFRITMIRWGQRNTASWELARDLRNNCDELVPGQPFLEFLQECVKPVLQSWDYWLHDVALRFVSDSSASYRRDRVRRGKLTYDDLLTESARLLRDDAEARRIFQSKYRRILVDEFQDTDPVQAAMLFYLTASSVDEQDWSKSRLIPGSLFLVGDDKQSIYRFRKADFQAFDLVRSAIVDQGGLDLELTVNFRSDPRICSWINTAVGGLFSSGQPPFQAPWQDLNAFRNALGTEFPVHHIRIGKSKNNRAQPRVRAESQAIIDTIHRLMDGEDSEISYGSFMIIVRRHANIRHFVDALTRAGIPVGVTGGKAELISDVLPMFTNLLRAIYDPDDGVALIATLRGPLFGVSDQDLFDFREHGVQDFSSEMDEAPESIVRSLGILKDLRGLFVELPVYRAFEVMLSRHGFEAAMRIRLDGDIASGMLQRLLALFRGWETKGKSLGECVDDLKLYVQGTLKLDVFSESMPFRQCVQILTVHQAKGLEADIVFLADVGGAAPRDATLHTFRKGAVVFGQAPLIEKQGYRDKVVARPSGWESALELERRFDIAERMRIMYVACTRARKQLIISTNEKQGHGAWDALLQAIEDSGVESAALEPIETAPEWKAVHRQKIKIPTPLTVSEVEDQIRYLSLPSWKIERPSEAREASPEEEYTAGRGREYGSAIHALFESLVARRKDNISGELVRQQAEFVMRSRFSSPGTASMNDVAAQAGIRLIESSLWADLQGASRVLTEVPFTISRQSDGVDAVVSGVADLAFRTDNGWTIVDYKTDRASVDMLVEKYGSQVSAYVNAWKLIFPDEACTGIIWSTESGTEIQIKNEEVT